MVSLREALDHASLAYNKDGDPVQQAIFTRQRGRQPMEQYVVIVREGSAMYFHQVWNQQLRGGEGDWAAIEALACESLVEGAYMITSRGISKLAEHILLPPASGVLGGPKNAFVPLVSLCCRTGDACRDLTAAQRAIRSRLVLLAHAMAKCASVLQSSGSSFLVSSSSTSTALALTSSSESAIRRSSRRLNKSQTAASVFPRIRSGGAL